MKKDRYSGLDDLIKKPNKKINKDNFPKDDKFVTPNDIISAALHDIYKIDPSDRDKLNEFMKSVVMLLSALATGGNDTTLFGGDMNDFFQLYVKTVNLCGRMKEVLDQNGIDFDINENNDGEE